jgi:hypothetical protein
MVRRAPPGFPLAVMDACAPALAEGCFDAATCAFVLFHLIVPGRALLEMHRVLAPGASLGTITWGAEQPCAAKKIWAEELDRSGAPEPAAPLSRHELVDTELKMRALLESAGFDVKRTWTGRYSCTMTVDQFVAHRTGHGASRWRFDSLDDRTRDSCLQQVRMRLDELDPEGLTERSDVIYAVASRR